ncbi:MAG: phosphoribosylformylglycinamidine synthase subunit PurQ [Chitinivibrionales bacterium]|nr:phosphoribosylformylglycinamidine synthase subunit PurQ [Chitinivibrionales bacterium]
MTQKLSVIILAGNGVNCEMETAHACRLAGFEAVDIITVWELLNGDTMLDAYNFAILPGGFVDGDDLGSAKAQANRILSSVSRKDGSPLIEQFTRFINDGKIILGICNGFQLMIKLGLIPALENKYIEQQATLTFNDSGKFEDRWVNLKVNDQSPCVFTRNITDMYLPVRHGEGKFIARDTEVLDIIKSNNQMVLSYVEPGSDEPTLEYPFNPNGSQSGVAGICDSSGRIFGLMPHPEAYLHKTNHPRWTRQELPEEGIGLSIFKNAREYIKSNL